MNVFEGSSDLRLFEELMLLAVRDNKGELVTGYLGYSLANAVMVELVNAERLAVSSTKKQLVEVLDCSPTGDHFMDRFLKKYQRLSAPQLYRIGYRNWGPTDHSITMWQINFVAATKQGPCQFEYNQTALL